MSLQYMYIGLLGIIAVVGILFKKTSVPIGLILVLVGMTLSLFRQFPHIDLNPDLVLSLFLPALVYQASIYLSLRDIKKYQRAILLLSIGHVFFITMLVGITIHLLMPQYGWPIAFLLGSIVSPPDDVAILAIAEKINLPQRLIIILKAEGILNDATALILFRFALIALVSHHFSPEIAVTRFVLILFGETLYGILLAHVLGKIRIKITDPVLHMICSVLTPFLAYIPAQQLGGSGVLATVVTGLVIGNCYLDRFTPEVRINSRAVWGTIAFTLQNILFLLVGLNFRILSERISIIPYGSLIWYSIIVIFVVIIGRFVWVFTTINVQRFKWFRPKNGPVPPWQYLFVVSWAGMRGGVSLAASLAVPSLVLVNNLNARDFIVFITFNCIVATLLIQGLTLPWVIKRLGVQKHREDEKYREHISELSARIAMVQAVLDWLKSHTQMIPADPDLSEHMHLFIKQYHLIKKQLIKKLKSYPEYPDQETPEELTRELTNEVLLASRFLEVERAELDSLWQSNRISFAVKSKLLQQLDFRASHLEGYKILPL